jgi:hypothetical protein
MDSSSLDTQHPANQPQWLIVEPAPVTPEQVVTPAPRKQISRRTLLFRVFAVLLALAVALAIATPSLLNYFYSWENEKLRVHEDAYEKMLDDYSVRMGKVFDQAEAGEISKKEAYDSIVTIYEEGLLALRALSVEHLGRIYSKDATAYEMTLYDEYRSDLLDELILVMDELMDLPDKSVLVT